MQVRNFPREETVRDPFPSQDKEPVNLAPFLRKGPHYVIADLLYGWFFQPVFDLVDRINAHFTRKWCESNTPQE